jgi:hypothetical protein
MRRGRDSLRPPQAVKHPFRALGEQQVADSQPGNSQQEGGRGRNKAEPRSQWRERQHNRKYDHRNGGDGEEGMWAAL